MPKLLADKVGALTLTNPVFPRRCNTNTNVLSTVSDFFRTEKTKSEEDSCSQLWQYVLLSSSVCSYDRSERDV